MEDKRENSSRNGTNGVAKTVTGTPYHHHQQQPQQQPQPQQQQGDASAALVAREISGGGNRPILFGTGAEVNLYDNTHQGHNIHHATRPRDEAAQGQKRSGSHFATRNDGTRSSVAGDGSGVDDDDDNDDDRMSVDSEEHLLEIDSDPEEQQQQQQQQQPIALPVHSDGKPDPYERLVPLASTFHIMKEAIPAEIKVADMSKIVMQEAASEFISFINSEALELQGDENPLQSESVLQALEKLGFSHMVKPLRDYLAHCRETLDIGSSKRKKQTTDQKTS